MKTLHNCLLILSDFLCNSHECNRQSLAVIWFHYIREGLMKNIFVIALLVLLAFVFAAETHAQVVDPEFTVSTLIKPKDYPTAWPDSVAAWRVYSNYDLDKDGKKEFLVIVDNQTTGPADTSTTTMPRILRFEANGNDKYDLVWSAQIPGPRAGNYSWPSLCVADMDKDGNQEIFVAIPANASVGSNPNPDRVFVYEYDPALGNFPTVPTMTSNLGMPPGFYCALTSVTVANADGDADLEMVLSSRRDGYGGIPSSGNGRTLMVYHLLGSIGDLFSSFEREFIDSSSTFKGGYFFNADVLDFDGDGKPEIWGYTWDMLSLAVYESTGPNTYVLQRDINQVTSPDDIGEHNGVRFYDANKDGKLEMFWAGASGDGVIPGRVYYLPNVTDVSKIDSTKIVQISTSVAAEGFGSESFRGADIGDLDGDGKVDFVIAGAGTHREVYRLEYNSGAYTDSNSYSFKAIYSAPNDSTYEFYNVAVGNDLDGDGKREVIIVNTNTRHGFSDASLIILENKTVVNSVKQVSSVPAEFALEQNFPNPFNPSSTIRFSLKNDAEVQLFITNSLGQRVGSLVNHKMQAGTHEVTFTGDGLSSGAYFYTLKAGSFSETKKMILTK